MRISFFRDRINNSNPANQEILVGNISAKWQGILNEFPMAGLVFQGLRRDEQGQIVVSREDVFATDDMEQRIIKALIWGYPKGMQGTRNLQNIIANMAYIVQQVQQYKDGALVRNRFLALCRNLYAVSGLKQSTLGKILYFCDVSVGQNQAIIVDANVLGAFECFDDFYGVSYESDPAERYYSQITKINAVARALQVNPDQIEFFLFNLGKAWKQEKIDFLNDYRRR